MQLLGAGPWRALAAACFAATCFAATGLSFAFATASFSQDDETTGPQIYRWIDENGIAHYTTELERIPSALRGRAGTLGGETASAPRSGSSDLWVSQDRGVTRQQDQDEWFDEGGTVVEPRDEQPLDPAVQAAVEEEQAVAQFDLDLRIAELQQVIQADEEALKTMISDPESGGPLASGDNPEFRTIAMRLPGRLQELKALREQRAALDPSELE